MDPLVRQRLVELNLELYRRYAREFSGSRRRLQPGILRALGELGPMESLADIGCGDARVGRALREGRAGLGRAWSGRYLGVDACQALLDLAFPASGDFQLVRLDLTEPGWSSSLSVPPGGFEALVLFSSLHHIPGAHQRREFLRECSGLLADRGRWAVSVWRFLHLDRFRRRCVSWSEIGLRADDVEEGDVLQDWRRGGHALRYVHAFEEDELVALCEDAGLKVEQIYHSDGESGDLGLYLTGCRRSTGSPVSSRSHHPGTPSWRKPA